MPVKKADLAKSLTKKALVAQALAEHEEKRRQALAKKIAKEKELKIQREKDEERALFYALSQRCIELAGRGEFLLVLGDRIAEGVQRSLRARGFRVATPKEELAIVERGLSENWVLPTKSPHGLTAVLWPLHKFLSRFLAEEFSGLNSHKINPEMIANNLLFYFYKDASANQFLFLRKRLERLLKIESDIDQSYFLLSDFVENQDERIEVRQSIGIDIFSMSVPDEKRTELFEIVRNALDRVDREQIDLRLLEEHLSFAKSIEEKIKKILRNAKQGSLIVSWWASLAVPPYGEQTYTTRLFWLASPAGQSYCQELSEIIDYHSTRGENSFVRELKYNSAEWCMAWIISNYLSLCGYKVRSKGRLREDKQLVISW